MIKAEFNFTESTDSHFVCDLDSQNKIAGQEIIRLRARNNSKSLNEFSFTGLDFARGAGFTAFNLWINKQTDSKSRNHALPMINLFGAPPLAEIEKRYESDRSPYPGNVFFQTGAAALFPLANRLRNEGPKNETDVTAKILGCEVSAPRNLPSCHLHGLTFNKNPEKISVSSNAEEVSARAEFAPRFYGLQWTGEARLAITHTLTRDSYVFSMLAENTGTTAIPMGMGGHPYFKMPSADFRNLSLRIPSVHMVKIDSYETVFPTGEIVDVPADLNFSGTAGAPIAGRYLDNLWVQLQNDAQGKVRAELTDAGAAMKMTMTALTENIVGIQAYCPKESPVVALEFVTHLPDPREALWRTTPTGMKLVSPGGTMTYGYKIELSKLGD